jgi:hypothetical protein
MSTIDATRMDPAVEAGVAKAGVARMNRVPDPREPSHAAGTER